MSNQLFEEDTPSTTTPKNARPPRTPRVVEPVDALRDPFADDEALVVAAEPPSAPEPAEPAAVIPPAPVVVHAGPRILADERQSVTHTLNVGGCEGLVVVGLFDDGTPGEVLLVLRRAPQGAAEALGALTETLNLALPYGVPIGALSRQLMLLIQGGGAQQAGQYIADYLTSKFG